MGVDIYLWTHGQTRLKIVHSMGIFKADMTGSADDQSILNASSGSLKLVALSRDYFVNLPAFNTVSVATVVLDGTQFKDFD